MVDLSVTARILLCTGRATEKATALCTFERHTSTELIPAGCAHAFRRLVLVRETFRIVGCHGRPLPNLKSLASATERRGAATKFLSCGLVPVPTNNSGSSQHSNQGWWGNCLSRKSAGETAFMCRILSAYGATQVRNKHSIGRVHWPRETSPDDT